MKSMTGFTNSYLKKTDTVLCSDPTIPAVVIKGLAEHKVSLGAPLCPCRFYDDKEKEAKDGYWNCPCVPMRERKECHCMLFLTEDNAFAGTEQNIDYEVRLLKERVKERREKSGRKSKNWKENNNDPNICTVGRRPRKPKPPF